MRATALAALGVAAYLVFLAAGVPARWLEARLATAAPGRYEAHSMNGTLWRGDGQAVVNVPGGTLVVDKLEWRFLPARLLEGRVAFAIDVKGAGFEARYEAGRGLGGWGIRDLAVRADAALAAAALPFVGRWRPEGSVTLAAPTIDVSGDGSDIRGDATIEWKGAATTISEVRPLGSYRASLSADGPGANVAISTLEGPLRMGGNGRLEWPARLNFMGEARGEGPKAAGLAPLLDILGPVRADGARTIDVRWR